MARSNQQGSVSECCCDWVIIQCDLLSGMQQLMVIATVSMHLVAAARCVIEQVVNLIADAVNLLHQKLHLW